MRLNYGDYQIRAWQPADREAVVSLIQQALSEFGLSFDPTATDRDAVEVESYYWATGGEFWVVEQHNRLVGTGGYYPISRGQGAVEIRKMYLHADVRGKGIGCFLLNALEQAIQRQGFQEVWVETASVLTAAVRLYELAGYKPADGVETPRCDRVYLKKFA